MGPCLQHINERATPGSSEWLQTPEALKQASRC